MPLLEVKSAASVVEEREASSRLRSPWNLGEVHAIMGGRMVPGKIAAEPRSSAGKPGL